MSPGIEQDTCAEVTAMLREYDQGIVFSPVASYVGTYRFELYGSEMKFLQMQIEIIAPLIAESTILETDIDQKVVHEWRGGDMVV